MSSINAASELAKHGQYAEAYKLLSALSASRADPSVALLKASVCEFVGDLAGAESIAQQVLRSRGVSEAHRAAAEYTVSRVEAAKGHLEAEVHHLHKALAFAERSNDRDLTAWARLRLIAASADRTGSDSCRPLVDSVRADISCAGNPNLNTALHLVVADAEGKHGSVPKSKRHVTLAQGILERYPNVWLSSWCENTLTALALVRSDYASALRHGECALRSADESGSVAARRSALGNLGLAHYNLGNFETALDYLERALALCAPSAEQSAGIKESIARVLMAQGNLARAEHFLDQAEVLDRSSLRSGSYVHRHSLVTKAELLMRGERNTEAARHFNEAVDLARRAGDTLLEDTVRLMADEVGFNRSAPDSNTSLAPPKHRTPDLSVLYERTLMCRLANSNEMAAALLHRERALRMSRAVLSKLAESDIERHWSALPTSLPHSTPTHLIPGALIQEFSSLLLHATRPELVASSLLALLQHTSAVPAGRVIARAEGRADQTVGEYGTWNCAAETRTYTIGAAGERTIDIELQPRGDIESQAVVNAVGFIIAAGQELERARIEREERLTLWPVDELPAADDESVVAGRMRELMIYARKVAQANVTVLITGESGTGKEVLARAIHRYSTRAAKPFVPFNCTAVPRELLESHLFGFKRGAFTGAERDNPGLIRAAKDGTLFLDEVGELGLDLQPKLLRFLESGEINPLGDTTPFSVNVRIVAATNANLKKLVEEGRFREDLYYRLNVIPLELPPLRERRDEIPPLAQHFALKWSHELGKGCIRVDEDLMEHLVLYPWPGNIRQLSNEIHRMVATAEPDVPLTLASLPRALREQTEQLKRRAAGGELSVPTDDTLARALSLVERQMISMALRQNQGHVEAAARSLGISRKGLYLKRQRLGL